MAENRDAQAVHPLCIAVSDSDGICVFSGVGAGPKFSFILNKRWIGLGRRVGADGGKTRDA